MVQELRKGTISQDILEWQKEQAREKPQFSSLRFNDLSWKEVPGPENTQIFRTKEDVKIGETVCNLEASHRIYHRGENMLSAFCFQLTNESGSEAILFLNLHKTGPANARKLTAQINVSRHDGLVPLPQGIGVKLYEKVLEFLENIESDLPLFHKEVPAPDDEDEEKWERRFGPVLKQHGYTKINGSWQKEYRTNKQEAA